MRSATPSVFGLLALVVIVIAPAPARGAGPTAPPLPAAVAAKLQGILTASVAASGAMGAQAAVRIPGHAPWSGVAGFERPGQPLRPERMIGLGSISKMCTAVAAMLLIDRGVIALGDTVGRWFPDAPNVDPSISVHRLLQQTSGIAEYAATSAFGDSVRARPDRLWRPEELLGFVGPPLFAPGAGWNASNTNRLLLGMIVERETGRSLGEFMRSEVFAGSPSTWVSGDGAVPAGFATHWIVTPSGERVNANERVLTRSVLSARREVQASAEAVAGLGERLFAGNLLSDGLRARMLEFVPSDGKVPGETGGGLGIRRYGPLGTLERTTIGHSGANTNNASLLLFDPVTRITVAVTLNQGAGHGNSQFSLAPALLKAAIDSVPGP